MSQCFICFCRFTIHHFNNLDHDVQPPTADDDEPVPINFQNDLELSDSSNSDEDAVICAPILNQNELFLHKLVDFIHLANLNKNTLSNLLLLLRSYQYTGFIPSTSDQLWRILEVSFNYDLFIYCSSCLLPLKSYNERCSSSDKERNQANSELIVFSIDEELKRVVHSNIQLIRSYSKTENQIEADFVRGKNTQLFEIYLRIFLCLQVIYT